MKKFDRRYLTKDVKYLAGVDEAGRGPLAGPVVAAAVIFHKDTRIKGVNDSKQLTEMQREKLYKKIIKRALSYSVSVVEAFVIDDINILNATMLAMKQSVDNLSIKPDLILVDGNRKFQSEIPVVSIIKGDTKSFSIAAASILAKVTRDRLMKNLAQDYPQYLWEKNKGYATREHREIILKHGPSPVHRNSFLKKLLTDQQVLEFSDNQEEVDS